MENLRTPNKTPSNILENLPRELREAVNRRNTQTSPFVFLPNQHTTPPSRFIKIRNPFEAAINDQLHKHIFSPSVFAEVKNPRSSDKFKWTIEEVSDLRPTHIDVSTVAQFEQSTSEDDVHVQAKIEKYFSETHIVPSPFSQGTNQVPLLPESDSPAVKSLPEPKEKCNVWTQTVLSLPPTLPEAVEKALLPYFTFSEDQRRQTVDLNSSLCRRLFFGSSSESAESSVSSIHSELSVIGSPVMDVKDTDKRKRNYDSSPESPTNLIPPELSPIPSSTPRKLSNCPISPITISMEHVQCRGSSPVTQNDSLSPIGVKLCPRSASRSFAKADFSGHMSVDNSFNLAPENEFVEGNNTNLSESPVRTNEFMESSCNWDLEYNSISISNRSTRRSLFESRNTAEKMDISNLTTPKSKIIQSQRKKLSDSFKFSESLSDDEILNFDYEENLPKLRKFSHEVSSKIEENLTSSQNTQDTGYQTEFSQKSNLTKDDVTENEDIIMEENKENCFPNIYASTPSKRYFSSIDK